MKDYAEFFAAVNIAAVSVVFWLWIVRDVLGWACK